MKYPTKISFDLTENEGKLHLYSRWKGQNIKKRVHHAAQTVEAHNDFERFIKMVFKVFYPNLDTTTAKIEHEDMLIITFDKEQPINNYYNKETLKELME